MDLYIGLMSGTSADGIDAAVVNFEQKSPSLIASLYVPYPPSLRKEIRLLSSPGMNEIQRLGELDVRLGKHFAETINQLLQLHYINPASIKAIGSHGQTIRHQTHFPRFSLQIGDPNIIAAETGITTIADFRRKDIALGGEGAPLVPAFHQAILAASIDRAIINIGGIANITILPATKQETIIGFDTGPGNALIDEWIGFHLEKQQDTNGNWAASGTILPLLLEKLLTDSYFLNAPPKSTGREYFNFSWLQSYLHDQRDAQPQDIQATLVELTATTIINAVKTYLTSGEILICGGGVHNQFLMNRLAVLAGNHFSVETTKKYGIDPDWVEAMAFAWFARQTHQHQTSNITSVTGATRSAILGGIYYP